MKLTFRPSFSTYFCFQLVIQICSTYCEVGHCANIQRIRQLQPDQSSESDSASAASASNGNRIQDVETTFSKLPQQLQEAQLHAHLEESLANDPFVFSWFKSQPKFIVEMLLRELFKNSINNEELLNAFLEGMFTEPGPGFYPQKLPKGVAGPGVLAQQDVDSTSQSESNDWSDPELEGRDFGSIISICSNARSAGRSADRTTTAQYDYDDDDVAPEGCYFYTGDMTYKNYLVCSDPDITEVPIDIPIELDVFEMNVTSVECIRPKAFENVSIQLLRLNRNKIQGVAVEAFEGAVGLKHLSMNYNYMRVPVWFTSAIGLEGIIWIEMESNKINMTALMETNNGQLFQQYEIDNRIDGEGPFLTKVQYISLSRNPLGFLPSFFFNRFAGANWIAITIYLKACNLHYIHPDAFTPFNKIYILDLSENPDLRESLPGAAVAMSKAKLQKLTLAHSSLSTIPREALSILEGTLLGLDMRGNGFNQLHDESFPHMSKLTALNLDECRLSQISKNAFENLVKLDTLSLKGNLLQSIPAALAPLVNLNILDMTGNNNEMNNQFIIPSKAFVTLTQLKSLILNDLKMRALNSPAFEGLTKLKLLYMKNSKLEALEDRIFEQTPGLTYLDMSDNDLHGLNANTFRGLDNLDSLYLRSCSLSFPTAVNSVPNPRNITSHYRKPEPGREIDPVGEPEQRHRIVEDPVVDFVTIGQLLNKALDDESEDDEDELRLLREPFRHLKRLKYLDLYGNNIEKLYPELFHTMPYLILLDLNKNSIGTWAERVFTNNTVLATLRLSGNKLLTTSDAMLEDFEDVYVNIDLTDNVFACDIGSCNLKSAVTNKSFYLTDWSSESRYQCFTAQDNRVPINSLSIQFCEALDSTSTTNNPGNGGPDAPPTTATTEGENPVEGTTTTASTKLPPGDETGSSRDENPGESVGSFSVSTTLIVVGCLVTVLVSSVVFYKKRLHLKYIWFDVKLNLMKGRGKPSGSKLIRTNSSTSSNVSEYDFDVFISYSHHDSGFIQEYVVPVLEGKGKFLLNDKTANVLPEVFNPVIKQQKLSTSESIASLESNSSDPPDEPAFKVCLHERDFEVGASITENIIECVDRSRKVVIVVSRNYLESQWCLFEMNLAYHRLIEVRRKSFVLILLEEVPAELRTKVLNYLMKSTTYLQWPGEKANPTEKKIFWTRLRHSLKNTA